MDYLYKIFDQLRDLWKSMTPAARVVSALMAAVIVVSALWLVRGTPEKTDHGLFGGREFSQSEIAKMTTAFSQAKLSDWEIVGNRIQVPSSMKHKYLAALAEANVLPDSPYSDIEEAIGKDNPFISVEAMKRSVATAKQKAVARTIMSMQGIESAVVLYDESHDKSFPRTRTSTASVTVHTKTNEPLDESAVQSIRQLVVSAYSGLKAANVAITDAKAGRTYEGPPADGAAGAAQSLYLEQKARTDRMYESSIRKALAPYPGVQVTVSSTLSPKMMHQSRTQKYEPKTVPYKQKDFTEETQNTAAGPSGVPGAASNGVNTNSQPVAIGSRGDTSKASKSISEQESVVGQTEMIETEAPLIPVDVKAAISVPAKYYLSVWQAQHPAVPGQPAQTPTPEELSAIQSTVVQNIENIVEKLLPPVSNGDQSFPRITVTTYQELPDAPVAAPSWFEWLMPWINSNWQAIGLGILGIVGVIALRAFLKPSAAEVAAEAAAEAEVEEEPLPELPPPGVISKLRERFASSGPSLREELHSLVKEDPEAAANVLRNWIGEAA